MKAIVVHHPDQFGLEEIPRPEVSPEGLLLRVEACGLCGGDLRTLRSGHPRVKFPWIIGHEVAGTVAAVGTCYRGPYQAGDRLAVGPLAYHPQDEFCLEGRHELCADYREIGQHWQGGFAEYLAIPPECLALGTIQPIPDGMDFALATLSEPVSSCVHAHEKGATGLGDSVVVIGAGPVGAIHVCLARARGARQVILVDIAAARLELCQRFSPDQLVNASKTDPVAEVQRLTRGRGAEVIITANPSPTAQVQAVEMARKGGRVLLFGGLPKDQCRPGIDMNRVHYQALHLIGTTIFAPWHQRIALDLLATGRIPGHQLITDRLPLADFAEGVRRAREGQSLKVVFLGAPAAT